MPTAGTLLRPRWGLLADALEEAAGLQQLHWQVLQDFHISLHPVPGQKLIAIFWDCQDGSN